MERYGGRRAVAVEDLTLRRGGRLLAGMAVASARRRVSARALPVAGAALSGIGLWLLMVA